MSARWEQLNVDNSPMDIYLDEPQGEGPHPAVVVIMHGPGLDTFTQTTASRLAEQGYVVAAPNMFHHMSDYDARKPAEEQRRPQGAPSRVAELNDPHVVADVNATVAYLRGMPQVGSSPIGITGFCMGGRVSFLMAAVSGEFSAAAPFYGGNTMALWGDGKITPFDQFAQVSCPILAFFGEDDANPSPDDMQKLDAELSSRGKAHEFHSYPGAGHSFMSFDNPNSYREEAAKDAWDRLTAFFDAHLKAS
jgi:carboxymethylenebutenolidase